MPTIEHTITLTVQVDVALWASEYGIEPTPEAVSEDVATYYDASSLQDSLIPVHLRKSVKAIR